ncbi:MAG TPA: hypothetical protein VHD61_05220 [Lacunisphaera sp.]|nr:hypothetical protein [Lacunisphaera sp.]
MAAGEPGLTPTSRWRDPWWWLLPAILAVSFGLRLQLVAGGGRLLWSDETRYYQSQEAVARWAAGDFAAGVRAILGGADHLFFKVLGLAPAAWEQMAGPSPLVVGSYFAGFSVLNILLVWAIARAAGAVRREAAIAALLQAGAATHFYYARHYFPYDAGLTFGLLALWVGWRREAGAGRSGLCGVLAGTGFLTYNGAWLFGAMVLVGHVLHAGPALRRMAARAAWAAAGLLAPIVLAIGLARIAAQVDLLASFLHFARTIDQGDFGGGRRLLVDYFWSAEGLNLVLGGAGLLLVVAGALAARAANYALPWVAGAVFLVAGLVALSDGWHVFVVYGRTARVVVPLVCLASAFALERLWRAGGRPAALASLAAGVAMFQSAANFSVPLHQVFPPEFQHRVAVLKDQLRRQGERRQLVVLYGDMLTGRASLIDGLPDHDVLFAEPHPMQYRPYLFEGFKEDVRDLFARTDIRMQLIAVNHARFDHPAALLHPYPGVVRMTLEMPDVRPPGVPEPILVTGETGRGDFIYLVYQADSSLRIGFDHWGVAGLLSDPTPVDFTKPVTITLSTGPLHDDSHAALNETQAIDPRRWLYVEINGQVIWSRPAEFHAAPPDSISFLNNYIGGSTAGRKFTGRVVKIQSLLLPHFAAEHGAGP